MSKEEINQKQVELLRLAVEASRLKNVPDPSEALMNHIQENQDHMTEVAEEIGELLIPTWRRYE